VWPELPIEFNVVGTPVSCQAENTKARVEWKYKVLAAAQNVVEQGSWAYDETRLSVTMFYFPQGQMQGDLDNIVKLTLDALVPNIYLDDCLIDRVLVQRFSSDDDFSFASPSGTLAAAVALDEPVLYIRIAEVPSEELGA
jgi:hypothetical protein